MHGFPDNTHLYDRLLPYLIGRRPVVRFDFLGWGSSDKPPGYPYTAANQVGDLDAVIGAVDEHLGAGERVLVAHNASGPPAIDWALGNPGRVSTLVLLNTSTTGSLTSATHARLAWRHVLTHEDPPRRRPRLARDDPSSHRNHQLAGAMPPGTPQNPACQSSTDT
jgi:pimeloyl-ACP methyl ester carboxylesterase